MPDLRQCSRAMLCSVLPKMGIKQVAVIEQEMLDWMEEYECKSVSEMHVARASGTARSRGF